jgi:tetratricopeptide (TPR) repeat protein
VVDFPPLRLFSREEARRAVGISERQLRAWERQELIPASETFNFHDVLALKTLHQLRVDGVPWKRVRDAVGALRLELRGVRNPLTAVKLYSDGRRIGVQIEGRKMEPITGQLLLDFDKQELKRLLSFPAKEQKTAAQKERARKSEAEQWFQKGLDLEMAGALPEEIMEAYRTALEFDPQSAGALVNLGTVHFNAAQLKQAEGYYRQALEVDDSYPLAHFNLGNLYDEKGDRKRALTHYEAAIALNPRYADAHYNLALLYQVSGQVLKAVHHWRTYLRLDPSSSWSAIARRELDKLRAATIVRPTRPSTAG